MVEKGLVFYSQVELGSQGNKKKPREKIRGSQNRQKKEKTQSKKVIRNPFIRKR